MSPICCPTSYMDARCLAGRCHHGPRVLTFTEELPSADLLAGKKPKKTLTKLKRIMECPVRSCKCVRGVGFTVVS